MSKRIKCITIFLLAVIFLCSCNLQKPILIFDDFGFFSLEQFANYLESNKIAVPECFVYWDKIESWGEFYHLDLTDAFNTYTYIIKVDGFDLCLEIDHTPEPIGEDVMLSEEVTVENTMYRTALEGKVIVQRGDLNYYYEGGKLAALFWYLDGTKFTITGDLEFLSEGYDLSYIDEWGIMIKLFCHDEAVANAAFAEIMQKLAQ